MGGVEIETLKEGDGANFPKAGQKVSCHYVLTLTNGKKIDSSRDRGSAFEFNIGRGEVSVDICVRHKDEIIVMIFCCIQNIQHVDLVFR